MRLHAIVDDLDVARRALAGGATVLQLRIKGEPTVALIEQGRPFASLCRERGALFIVNDDVQAALALSADGVHLGRGDAGADLALATGLLLGLSAADVSTAVKAELAGAAYVGAGPVWETPTKPAAAAPIGLDGLATICEAISIPAIAIGGVGVANAADCLRAGAAGVAVVRGSMETESISAAIDGVATR